jgi:hypothetical protein
VLLPYIVKEMSSACKGSEQSSTSMKPLIAIDRICNYSANSYLLADFREEVASLA